MKKFFTFLIIAAIIGVFYTEKTGKTNFRAMFQERVLGITEEDEAADDEPKYKLTDSKPQQKWDPAKEAIKDADSYHKEAKDFAGKTSNTIKIINESVK